MERFRRDGFVALRGAIDPEVTAACRDEIWARLAAQGVDRRDRSTWREPLVRMWCPRGGPFARLIGAAALREASDQLLGRRAWVRGQGDAGTVPVRFPVGRRRPADAVWHLDGGWAAGHEAWVNVQSRGRGLVALHLLSRTGPDDAPTSLLVGSHLDLPSVLAPAGRRGMVMWDAITALPRSTFRRPVALATGAAGDVFLLHPFLVHAATWPHDGPRPRVMVQRNIATHEPFRLDPRDRHHPVEQAILDGLDR
jgi:hypothetical protein